MSKRCSIDRPKAKAVSDMMETFWPPRWRWLSTNSTCLSQANCSTANATPSVTATTGSVTPLRWAARTIEEAVGRSHRGRHQQRLGAGKVSIDGLSCHAEDPRHVGDPHRRAAFVDDLVGGVQDALDGLLVGGGVFPAQP